VRALVLVWGFCTSGYIMREPQGFLLAKSKDLLLGFCEVCAKYASKTAKVAC
jgi:hypothetical protein